MTQHLLRPALLYPDPLKLSDLMSWDAAGRFLLEEWHRGGAAFVDTFLAAARNHQAPFVGAHIDETIQLGAEVERAMALLGAAAGGHIVAYARRIDDHVSYEIVPALWLAAWPWVANPTTIALTGRLSLVKDLLAHDSLEARLAGCPILVNKPALTTLLRKRAGNEAERLEAARKLVEEWIATHDLPMRKALFTETLGRLFPGVSGRELERLRVKVWPPAWRQPGPR